MTIANTTPHSIKTIRWNACIWSILVTASALLTFFSPDSYGSGQITPVDTFLLSLTGLTILGFAHSLVSLSAASDFVPDRLETGEKDKV